MTSNEASTASQESTVPELNDEFLHSLFTSFEQKELPIKEAAIKSTRREYIKEKDFIGFTEKNKDYIIEQFNKVMRPKLSNKNDIAEEILKRLVDLKFLLPAVASDYDRKPKYPKRLNLLNPEDLEEDSEEESSDEAKDSKQKKTRRFFVINFERPENKSYLWLTTLVVIVLGFCMFPIWPLELKLTIWWISWILLVLIIGIFSIRLALYTILYIIGYDFWLFPNLTDDKLGVIDSFKPLYSFEKRNETVYTIIIRIVIATTFGCSCAYLYQNPELVFDFIEHLEGIYSDVLSWGNEKIIHYHNGTGITLVDKSNSYRKLIEEEGFGID